MKYAYRIQIIFLVLGTLIVCVDVEVLQMTCGLFIGTGSTMLRPGLLLL
jgi:hypothetical protein